jgi:hypothetical protein
MMDLPFCEERDHHSQSRLLSMVVNGHAAQFILLDEEREIANIAGQEDRVASARAGNI